tara:strand:+ start:219 stop:419 length:201 start_codon:yes stop_codon:yes gene_type:complete
MSDVFQSWHRPTKRPLFNAPRPAKVHSLPALGPAKTKLFSVKVEIVAISSATERLSVFSAIPAPLV